MAFAASRTAAPHSNSALVPTPLLDHVMVLLDDETYRDVASCDYLPERLCRIKTKTADSSVAGAYSTLGLAGRNTLLELFAGAIPGPRRFTGGLVFSFAFAGSAIEARRVLAEQAGIGAHYQLVTRADAESGEQRPWYHLLAPDLGADSPLLVMLNEVTPEYFTSLGASLGADGEMSRRDYLDAVLGGEPTPRQNLADLTGVTLRLRPGRVTRLREILCALGYQADGDTVHGGAFTVTFEADESAPEGVTEVRLALLDKPEEPVEFAFGAGARLSLAASGAATWTFTPIN